MRQIPLSTVKKWQESNGKHLPSSISACCPKCDALAIFSLKSHTPSHSVFWTASSQCPGCGDNVLFLIVNPGAAKESPHTVEELLIYPSPSSWRQPIPLTDNVPEPLKRSFESTISSYNSKNYVATVVGCRRTLEAIFKYRSKSNNKKISLVNLIEEVKNSEDLAQPLNTISDLIREGGNLGAHFDEKLEPDQDMSRHMVELLEYLISYLYVLPSRIENLDKSLVRTTS